MIRSIETRESWRVASVSLLAMACLHEELRQNREHFAWLESEGHSSSQVASGLRKEIERLEEQIETQRATGRIP
jgi:hypothetical protein